MDIGLRQGWSISTTVLLELLKKRSQSVSAHKSRALFLKPENWASYKVKNSWKGNAERRVVEVWRAAGRSKFV